MYDKRKIIGGWKEKWKKEDGGVEVEVEVEGE